MKLFLLLLSISAATAFAQNGAPIDPPWGNVVAVCSGEPNSDREIRLKDVEIDNCFITNFSNHPVTLTPGMVLTALPGLAPLNPNRAQQQLKEAFYSSKKNKALRIIGYLSIPAMAVTGGGFVAASAVVVGGLGIGLLEANQVSADLRSALPDLNAYGASPIPDQLTLDAFQTGHFGASFTVFAAKRKKGADTITGNVYFPPASTMNQAPVAPVQVAPTPVVPSNTTPQKNALSSLMLTSSLRAEYMGLEGR